MALSSSNYLAPFASAARTATATSAAVELVGATMLTPVVTVTAQSGTAPTLDVTVEGSPDGTTGWHTIATVAQFAASTGTKQTTLGPTALPRFIRTVATIAGTTPSFTFSVGINVAAGDGTSATGGTFVTQSDFLAQGASGRELQSASSTVNQTAISAATDITGLSITFTVGSRPVWVEAYCPFVFVSTTSTAVSLLITDEANVVKRTATQNIPISSGTGMEVRERISTPGTYTRKARLVRASGAGTIANNLSGDATYVSIIKATEE